MVIEKMESHRGGRERSVAEIAAELARRGHDVTVLCQSGDSPAASFKVMPLGTRGLFKACRLANFVKDVERAAKSEGFDVVHATLPVPCANVYQPRGGTVPGQLAGKDRRLCPVGRVLRRLSLRLNFSRVKARRLERRVAADLSVTCMGISRMVSEEFAVHYGRRENVRTVYGGVDVPRVDEAVRASWRRQQRAGWGARTDSVVFLTVAGNFVLKGIAETVEAFAEYTARFPEKDARLVAVGGGNARRYRRLAARLGVSRKVIFEGASANVFEQYSAADAIVLLSWQDACSRVVLEAIRWGVPSITTQYNGAAELLSSRAGIVVESPNDRAGVVAAMAELAEPRRRLAMTDACRRIADYVGIRRQVDELEQVYKEIIAR